MNVLFLLDNPYLIIYYYKMKKIIFSFYRLPLDYEDKECIISRYV